MKSAQVSAFLVEAIQKLPRHRPLRVGIDGRSSSGKTTLADALADRLEELGRVCLRASLDDFRRPGHERREKAGRFTPAEYLRESYDYAKIRELLLDPLGPGGNRRCRLDFWNSHDDEPFPEEWPVVDEDAILIADGGLLHARELHAHWDFTIWLEVDWQSILLRGARRDGTQGGPAALLRAAYESGWIPRQHRYEESVHPHDLATVVIDNSDVEHPFIVRAPRPTRTVP
jgi:uridine kinase